MRPSEALGLSRTGLAPSPKGRSMILFFHANRGGSFGATGAAACFVAVQPCHEQRSEEGA